MPYLVDCCKAYATVGEMANVFRPGFRRTQRAEYLLNMERKEVKKTLRSGTDSPSL